jgi:acyl-coenzyme A synthetase/AMP-(fatty) acid ligase
MTDYERECREFVLPVPERFSFPIDVFDRWGERQALFWTDGSTERQFTFRQLTVLSSKGAGFLRALGIGKGDKVLIMLPNIPEWWEVMLALMRLNAIPIPATTLLSSKDIAYRIAAAEIRAVITTSEDVPKVEDAMAGVIERSCILVSCGGGSDRNGWNDYVHGRDGADAFEGERAASGDPGLVYFTSGTTGHPKMVLHTQVSYPLAHLLTGKYWLDLDPDDLHWNLSDTGWAKAAWSSFFGPWNRGAAIFSFYRKGKFDPSHTMEIMQRYPITTFCGPPTAYRMIVKELAAQQKFRVRSLRHFAAAGEPLNREVIEIWKEKTGVPIYDGYGQTETINVLANFRCLPVKPGSMGKPVPGFVVAVIDEEGKQLPPGIEGDIAISTKPERPVGLFREYLGNPEATRHTTKGRWYLTGDRAYRDEEGYFWFVGRADDIILSSGYRIGPFEIESILVEHPAVKESAVVASPDEIRGEVVKAFIVPAGGFVPSAELVKEIQQFVKDRTAPYKYPRKIEFTDDLPKTVSGKIKRHELKLREFRK